MASQLKKLRRAAAIMHQPTPMLPLGAWDVKKGSWRRPDGFDETQVIVDEAAHLRDEEVAAVVEAKRKGFGLRHLIPILAFLGAGNALKKVK